MRGDLRTAATVIDILIEARHVDDDVCLSVAQPASYYIVYHVR